MENETKTKIIDRLTKHGYVYRKDFTVSVSYGGYSECLYVTIKNVKINKEAIKKLVIGLQSYERDLDGEILQGGNTFITVEYGKKKNSSTNIFEDYALEKYENKAIEIYKKYKDDTSSDVHLLFSDGKFSLNSEYDDSLCSQILFRGLSKNGNISLYEENRAYFTICDIAKQLAYIDLKYYEQLYNELTLTEWANKYAEYSDGTTELSVLNSIYCASIDNHFICKDYDYVDMTKYKLTDILKDEYIFTGYLKEMNILYKLWMNIDIDNLKVIIFGQSYIVKCLEKYKDQNDYVKIKLKKEED